ncbi:Putative papain-like cysteine peptidase (DUF1796), putative [Trypanosoma equiperdum]|uniref:Papain-like cysteine peptidase (DUF1796) n=2 Tax=Trypanozoon TaxID=39700 RepID=Q583N5_TRYB2|nr:hypothetical protein, conserved [Trypanosoma brucei brucei TREU927]AAX81002.1 hypothetical protein, conserved [Trypanosoma brucei]AAZ11861.1 hypothetical protein, conserved [Trypanosoma brucei brucei TREU927]SCU67666.1 Putative papain-like cysteine peptidase (DUF1796), putative [Trypanosoma equiperdum]
MALMWRWVSLGGWCGPHLMLSKLNAPISAVKLPFDMARCSFDGLLEFTNRGFDEGFFPGPLQSRPFTPDAASIWLLFRGQHTCITHFNLNNDNIVQEFVNRFDAWERMLLHPSHPVTFLRTSIAEDASEEVELIPQFHSALQEKSAGRLKFRTVMVLHDQGPTTCRVAEFTAQDAAGAPCVVWNLALDKSLPSTASLLDRCHDGYAQIISEMSSEGAWQFSTRFLCLPAPKPYTNLSRVEGVPALRGSCTGFGTTHAARLGRCLSCGATDGHKVVQDAFDTKRPWETAEEVVLVEKLFQAGGDEVAAVEAAALELKRGANEVLLRLRYVTQC